MAGPKAIRIGDDEYQVWFTTNALRRIEESIHAPFFQLAVIMARGRAALYESTVMLAAGLEGARLRMWPRAPAWTLDRAGDLFDKVDGGFAGWMLDQGDQYDLVREAFLASIPTKKAHEHFDRQLAAGAAAPADPLVDAGEAGVVPPTSGPVPSNGGTGS